MTQEDKELLFKYLCAMLPYHVRCKILLKDGTTEEGFLDLEHNYGNVLQDAFYYNKIKDIKPYLRPMSSMTEEERKEFTKLFCKWHDDELFDYIEEGAEFSIWKHKGISPVVFDWLNAHHFDYRGLIEEGLALEAKEGMYK